jgi:hypothetical protein
MLLNELKITNQTHAEKRLTAFVNMFQVFTGKLFTFITELHLVVQKQFASFLEKRALLVSRSTTLTVSHSHSFRSNIIFQRKIVTTNTTIHTTRRNQFFLQLAKPSTLLRK